MTEKEVVLSREGLQRMEEELEFLKNVKRKEIAERIKSAREQGDIAENSEYEDAKNAQAFIEGRILQLEKALRNARLLSSDDAPAGVVTLGSRVTLRNLESSELEEYQIVGTLEASPADHRISNESPVGSAIMGRTVGSAVEVLAPVGVIRYEIMEIQR